MNLVLLYYSALLFAATGNRFLFVSGSFQQGSLEIRLDPLVPLEPLNQIQEHIKKSPNLANIYLYEAVKQGKLDIIKTLVAYIDENKLSALTSRDVHYLLTTATLHPRESSQEIVEWLIEYGEKLACDADLWNLSPLHRACNTKNPTTVLNLLQRNADTNATNMLDATPLHYTCASGDEVIVQMLLDHQANVNALDKWKTTPLHYACQSESLEIVKMLIKMDANVNAVDFWNKTPLYYACLSGNMAVLRHLFENAKNLGHDIASNDSKPLLVALENEHYDCANLLINYGLKFEAVKACWFANHHGKTKVEFFLSNVGLFKRLSMAEQIHVLTTSTYANMFDGTLPSLTINSKLLTIFSFYSTNILREAKRRCDASHVGYYRFMFNSAKLFLQDKELFQFIFQESNLVTALRQTFDAIFANVDGVELAKTLEPLCQLLRNSKT